MKRNLVIFSLFLCISQADAAWYWPFGSDDDEGLPTPAELMKPATEFIDQAADFADDGKVDEAVAAYRQALAELARIELENPERVGQPEFATVRNKRAYIESAIDSLLLHQARSHAKAVAVTDTTELERRFAEEEKAQAEARKNRGKTSSDRGRAAEPEPEAEAEPEAEPVKAAEPAAEPAVAAEPEPAAAPVPVRPASAPAPTPTTADRRERMLLARADYLKGDYAAALLTIRELLKEKPNDAVALNLRAMVEKASGDPRAAEATLVQLITSNPQVYYGYYNLAKLILETRGEAGKEKARYYYDTGRLTYRGPEDRFLEAKLK